MASKMAQAQDPKPSKLDIALHYAREMGWYVFPVKPMEKFPPLVKWRKESTTNDKRIKEWWSKWPDANIGIDTGKSNLVVIDLDEGEYNATANLKSFLGGRKLPKSLVARTPRGKHLYFSTRLPYRNTASELGEGIDSRGDGGFVLAPGSERREGSYSFSKVFGGYAVQRQSIHSCPSVFDVLLRTVDSEANHNQPQSEITFEPGEEPHTELLRATEFLRVHAEPAIAGQGGDDQTYRVAAEVRDYGMSEETCLDLMLKHYNHRCVPPWEEGELSGIVKHAYRYAKGEPGVRAADSDFSVVTEAVSRPTFQTRYASEINLENIPRREWLLQRRYLRGYVSLLIAPGGVGKSLLTIAECFSLISGRPLSGFQVPRNHFTDESLALRTLLYNTEDPADELYRRVLAYGRHYGITDGETLSRLSIVSGMDSPLCLAVERNGTLGITDQAREFREFVGDNKFDHIVVDPFIRSHRVQENNNMSIDKVALQFSKIAQDCNCSVCLVHHSRKMNPAEGRGDQDIARGASSLVSAARIASTLTVMTEEEGKRFGLTDEERRRYVRLDNAKGNLMAPAAHATWYKKVSVELPNGDGVGVLEHVKVDEMLLIMSEKEADMRSQSALRIRTFIETFADRKQSLAQCGIHLFETATDIFEERSVETIKTYVRNWFRDEQFQYQDGAILSCRIQGKRNLWLFLEEESG